MADRHDRNGRGDDVDAWLGERIDPLAPPPGTFDLIKRRARRRKYRRLAITATSAAFVVAAAVTVPQVVNLPVLSENPTSPPVAGAGHSGSMTPTVYGSAVPPSTAGSGESRLAPVPDNFRPTSVTFVSTRTGWVIGQASTPGHCFTNFCTSVARTNDAGRTWSGVHAPLTGAPDGATGVSQIRFLELDDGWAYGPGLYATHSGGATWEPVDTGGQRVTDLETVGQRVFALWATCTGTGSAYAGHCTSFTLYSAPGRGGSWTPVGPTTTGLARGSSGQAPALTLTGSRGYLLTAGGTLYAGPIDGSAAWQKAGSLPGACDTAGTATLIGTVDATDLLAACLSPGSNAAQTGKTEQKLVYSSSDGGASWVKLASAPAAGTATSLSASPSGSLLLATDHGIELLPKGTSTWQDAALAAPVPAGGFSYVGMTTSEQGIALPADPSAGAVWFSFDGGQTWKPSAVSS